jgi:hypothetical protein
MQVKEFIKKKHPDTIDGRLRFRINSCDYEKKEALVHYEIPDWVTRSYPILPVGIVTTFADVLMGNIAFAFSPHDGSVTTVTIQVSYPEPVTSEQGFSMRCRIEPTAGKTIYTYAEAWSRDEPGRHIFTASGMFYLIPSRIKAEIQKSLA